MARPDTMLGGPALLSTEGGYTLVAGGAALLPRAYRARPVAPKERALYRKIFQSILDSSIAADVQLRRFFMDLILLADPVGDVNMTPEAIARRLNTTLEEVTRGLAELQKPDPTSRNPVADGRRIVPIEGQGFGWRVVNLVEYTRLQDPEKRRKRDRERQRRRRQKVSRSVATDSTSGTDGTRITADHSAHASHPVTPPKRDTAASAVESITSDTILSHSVTPCHAKSTTETETETERETDTKETTAAIAAVNSRRALTDWLISTWQESEHETRTPCWGKGDYTQLARRVKELGEPEVRRRWTIFLADPGDFFRGHGLRLFCSQIDRWHLEAGAHTGPVPAHWRKDPYGDGLS